MNPILKALQELEKYRIDLRLNKNDSRRDTIIQICQSIVAEVGGYTSRAEWVEEIHKEKT